MPSIVSKDGVIVGQEFDDTYSGDGTCYFDDGSHYTGEWKCGRMHGIGVLVNNGGDVFEGVFIDGKYVGKMEILKNGRYQNVTDGIPRCRRLQSSIPETDSGIKDMQAQQPSPILLSLEQPAKALCGS